ncbi:hypothetical protein [Amycolatopsis magusensis]|uniref:Beta/Gamma crystallin n=1 Tax=Amycolatopsis magusensis TaxID=882444 RepID=A0ABS4Q1R3_9PSEU|nr:hypothetical protein [Amycolatopsis magusensis]MBP2185601.1 hypothetical protein [Amycolatopsis magusensis]MDI5980692.1 hypothetical protein [Amycolatopsis magusensis]
MSPPIHAAAVAAAVGVALSVLPAVAAADSGNYIVASQNAAYTFSYQWYRDLPADVHQQGLQKFTNATDVQLCTAQWDRGSLYRIQAYPPGTRYAPADSATDAIVDCRYFLA